MAVLFQPVLLKAPSRPGRTGARLLAHVRALKDIVVRSGEGLDARLPIWSNEWAEGCAAAAWPPNWVVPGW